MISYITNYLFVLYPYSTSIDFKIRFSSKINFILSSKCSTWLIKVFRLIKLPLAFLFVILAHDNKNSYFLNLNNVVHNLNGLIALYWSIIFIYYLAMATVLTNYSLIRIFIIKFLALLIIKRTTEVLLEILGLCCLFFWLILWHSTIIDL